jgi:2-keto-3-deoxy-L-rhamnonate aldolase RhmA
MSASSLVQIVRVPNLDRHLIEHALDLGAHGVLVPKVENRDQATMAAQACRFPPQGSRGVNPIRASGYFTNLPDYFRSVDARTICAIQVETLAGVENIDEIIEVPGVDVVFIGVGDLACSLGQPGVPDGPAMDAARHRVLDATLAAGKRPGIFAYSDELARLYAEEGFELIAVGNEIKLFMAGCSATTTAFRSGSGS